MSWRWACGAWCSTPATAATTRARPAPRCAGEDMTLDLADRARGCWPSGLRGRADAHRRRDAVAQGAGDHRQSASGATSSSRSISIRSSRRVPAASRPSTLVPASTRTTTRSRQPRTSTPATRWPTCGTLLDGIYVDARRDESKRLAQSVQDALMRRLRRTDPAMNDRGVKTAPFVVLVATDMPAILAEVSCLSERRRGRPAGHAALSPDHRRSVGRAAFRHSCDQKTHPVGKRKDTNER